MLFPRAAAEMDIGPLWIRPRTIIVDFGVRGGLLGLPGAALGRSDATRKIFTLKASLEHGAHTAGVTGHQEVDNKTPPDLVVAALWMAITRFKK